MSKKTTFTPGPLIADGKRIFGSADIECPHSIAKTYGDRAEADAAEIARRWNIHVDLLIALQDLVDDGECYCAIDVASKDVCAHCCAVAVLIKAKGK